MGKCKRPIPEKEYEAQMLARNAKCRPTMNRSYISSKRILVRYRDEGGYDKDGIIEIRPRITADAFDILMRDKKYAQVRIAVDSRWYIKGMALYSDNIPEGYDIVYYTRKPKGTPLKRSKKDELGRSTGTVFSYVSKKMPFSFGRHPIIIFESRGDWDSWSDGLSSHMLNSTYGLSIPPIYYINLRSASFEMGMAIRRAKQIKSTSASALKELEEIKTRIDNFIK